MEIKKRILVTISFSFSIRYIVRTGLLQQLRSFCEPVVAITWNQEDLIAELRAQGFEVHIIPEHKREPVYNDVRRKLDISFILFTLKSPTRKIQQIYLDQYVSFGNKLFRKTRELYNKLKLRLPFYQNHLFKKEEELLRSSTNFNKLINFVDSLNVDTVFSVTPFHKQEDILLRACKYRGKKMMTSILSFDNITKRGWIPVEYDLYMVWNKQNKEQLNRIYPFTKNKPVHITGPAQFDFYFKEEFLLPVSEWRRMEGIEAETNKKIILYAGGPHELFPYEPYYLKEIDDAINSGIIRNKPLVLFRCHPMDKVERWKNIVGKSENIVFDKSWGGSQSPGSANVSVNDIKKLCSTLAYTDVHINICSTMTVDGSAFGKPQIGPAYATHTYSNKLIANLYKQEHFAPIMETKGLQLAHSPQQLMELINNGLEKATEQEEKSKEILKGIITHCDGRSTERVAEVIKNFLGRDEINKSSTTNKINKRIKVLYVQVYGGGGSLIALYEMLRQIDKTLIEPVVLCYYKNQYTEKLKALPGCKLIYLPATDKNFDAAKKAAKNHGKIFRLITVQKKVLKKYFVDDKVLVQQIYNIIQSEKPDIVHHNNDVGANSADIRAALKAGVVSIIHNRSLPEYRHDLARYILDFRLIRKAALRINITEAVRKHYDNLFHLSLRSSMVLHDFVDSIKFKPSMRGECFRKELSIEKNEFVITNIGRITHWKGQHVLIEAINLIKDELKNCKVLIVGPFDEGVGSKEYYYHLKGLINAYKLEHIVQFTGNREDISDVINASDLVVHTAVKPEPQGLVIIEAMLCNKMVIASDAGGAKELIEKYGGVLTKCGDASALAQMIQKVFNWRSNGVPEQYAIRSKKIIKDFEGTAQLEHLTDTYYKILSTHKNFKQTSNLYN